MTERRPMIVLAIGLLVLASPAHAKPTAYRGARLMTVANGTIENGVLVVDGGKIVAAGAEVKVPDGAEVVDLTGKTVIPGLVDTHAHYGIGSIPMVPAQGDTNEGSGPVQPELRALDAIFPQDPGISFARAGGITTSNIMPGSGNVMGGQTVYVKLRGRTVEEMLVQKEGIVGGMKMANGENPKRSYGSRGEAPMTRMAIHSQSRKIFLKAKDYRAKWDAYRKNAKGDAPARDLGLEAVIEIMDGKRIVQHHTHRADDAIRAMDLAQEFGFRIVLHHVSEGWKIADEIARRKVPCSIIVIDSPGGKHEAADFRFETGGVLERAGVKVAIHTDHWINDARFLLREAALAVQYGMTEEGALRALTQNGAEMLDLGSRVGSLETGKDADFVVLSGPPFSVYTKVLQTYIEGQKVFDRTDPRDLRFSTGGFAAADRYPTGKGGDR